MSEIPIKRFKVIIKAYGDYVPKDILEELNAMIWVSGISGFEIVTVDELKEVKSDE